MLPTTKQQKHRETERKGNLFQYISLTPPLLYGEVNA